MFRLHFGKFGHNLTEEDFKQLAKDTEGYSGSDIANVAHTALNYPVKLLQRCHWFKRNDEGLYEPAKEGEGEQIDVFELPKGEVVVPVFRRVGVGVAFDGRKTSR